MRLAILDVDGTLTDTNEVDTECYLRALADCFAITGVETDWASYPHTTDAGILTEIFQRHFQRCPTSAEIERMQHSFLAHLGRSFQENPAAYAPVKGAGDFLNSLNPEQGWACVVATGGWNLTARFKLKAANLAVTCPIISSDHAVSRSDIVQKAIGAAGLHYEVETFARLVSVGDGLWDVKTAQTLSLPFVGIAQGSRANRLKGSGASHVLPDFADLDATFAAMNQALVPGPNGK